MPSESAERRAARAQQLGAPLPSPAEQDPLPCPRCDSTNTKFCYYNNYNFSQPRHFCKACRRYWTHGGTLRDIPIGGGTRKSAKRSRTSSGPTVTIAAGSHHHPPIPATPVFASLSSSGSAAASFTSLLMSSGGGPPGGVNVVGPMGGFGFGLGLEEVGFGLGRGVWATTTDHHHHHHHHQVGYDVTSGSGSVRRAEDTWHVESGGDHQSEFGAAGGGDCFASLPELAISTPGGLK